jgi:hypothetical protein
MELIGSLRLVAGLVFLGVVIALCLWLLIRLFPGTAPGAFRKHTEREQDQTSGDVQQRSQHKNG